MFEILAAGHHSPMDSGMSSADVIGLVKDLGVPVITALACLWFIRYIYDASAKEREKFLQRDEANDRRAFELAEKSNEAMNKLSQAVEMNTKAIEENGKAVAEMVNLLRAKLI